MSQDFTKVLISDDRLAVTDKISFGVLRSGQNVTVAKYEATSSSSNSITWSVQVPSEQTVLSRRVLWRSKCIFTIKGIPANNEYLFDPFRQDAFAQFPLHQLVSTLSATINNTTVSVNVNDVLPIIARQLDPEMLGYFNSYTPSYPDSVALLSDLAATDNNNVNNNYRQANNNKLLPRGAWYFESITGNTVGDGTAEKTVNVTAVLTEPLMISPFVFAPSADDEPGFYGIQNLNVVANIRDAKNAFKRLSNTQAWTSVAVQFETAELIFDLLTPKPSQLLAARNVVKYYELPRFISSQKNISAGLTERVSTQSLQLNQIPQYIMIAARKAGNDYALTESQYFHPIESISVQFNNQSGILSSATQQDLYQMSVHNGLKCNWNQFYGVANASTTKGTYASIKTNGAPLILEMGKDIQITEDFYSISSLGNFNLQIDATVRNWFGTQQTVELVVIPMNVGVFVSERGASSVYTGILTKQDVLDASQQEAYGESEMKRLVGGANFMDNLKSMLKRVAPMIPGLAKCAVQEIASVGSGKTGAGVSAGRMARRLL